MRIIKMCYKFLKYLIFYQITFISCIECLSYISKENHVPQFQVKTLQGIVQGRLRQTYEKKLKYFSFQGIPFAQPPLGELRFKAPLPSKRWLNILDVTKERKSCIESLILPQQYDAQGEEDCLYLNVFSPRLKMAMDELLPVLVYIYEGGFDSGTSKFERYGPDYFIDQDIVVVTFNYRTGILGFLSTGDHILPGNMGLKDQTLALKWVQNNIHNFGGNANLVTIYGVSAGAASAQLHLVSPLSKGLFQRIIMQSGSSLSKWAFQRNPKRISQKIGLVFGIPTNNSSKLISGLRRIQGAINFRIATSIAFLYNNIYDFLRSASFSPVIEPDIPGAFLTKTSYELLKNGDFQRVPVLTGITTLETGFFQSFFSLLRPLFLLFDVFPNAILPQANIPKSLINEAVKDIRTHYFHDRPAVKFLLNDFLSFSSDDQFLRPIRKGIELMQKHTSVYVYQFAYESNYGLKTTPIRRKITNGTIHTEDLYFLWKRQDIALEKPHDILVQKQMIKLWTNFIKYGNPTPYPDSLLNNLLLPPISSKNITNIKIDKNLSIQEDLQKDSAIFWETFFKKYTKPPYYTY